jgi:hypothetical protein
MSETKASRVVKKLDKPVGKRCSDFDEDCADVKDYHKCWLGCTVAGITIEQADGYCPFIHKEN